jgi:hypothetical protein
MPERAIEHVVDQQTTIENINDEDNVNVIRTTDSLTSGEMLHLEMYSFFKYDHPHDDDEKKFKHSVCHNFLLNNNNMCHIFAMAIGIPEFSKMTETAPFTQTKKKEYTNVFRPLQAVLVKEINRRAHFLFHRKYKDPKDNPLFKNGKLQLPSPQNWPMEKCLKFLKDEKKRLAYQENDYSFLREKIKAYTKFLEREINAKKKKPDQTSWDCSGWEGGIVPNIRLIEIILSDDLRMDFIHRNDAESRTQLDARNTESASLSFFEKVRQRFNDPSVKIMSTQLDSSWGRQVFLEPHECNWNDLEALKMAPIPDENTCKKHFMNLNNALGTVFQNWKNSGNGDNQLACNLEEAEANVEVDSLPTQGGDRIDFLGTRNICVMYLWFMLLTTKTFLHARNEFPSSFQADDGVVPEFEISSSCPTSGASSKTSLQKKKERIEEQRIEKITGEIDKLKHYFDAKDDLRYLKEDLDRMVAKQNRLETDIKELKTNRSSLLDKIVSLEDMIEPETSGSKIVRYQQRIQETKEEVEDCEKELSTKKKDLEDILLKIKEQENAISLREKSFKPFQDKTPKRSGSSVHSGHITNPPTTVLVGAKRGRIDFDTPMVGDTPNTNTSISESHTATESQLDQLLKRQRTNITEKNAAKESVEVVQQQETEESVDILQQSIDDYDED